MTRRFPDASRFARYHNDLVKQEQELRFDGGEKALVIDDRDFAEVLRQRRSEAGSLNLAKGRVILNRGEWGMAK